jgi:hypothetical protein
MELIFVAAIIMAIFVLFNYLGQKKIPKNTLVGFTGALGSGKTYLGVREAIKHYRHIKFLRFLKIIKVKRKPEFYSNIPIYLGRKYVFWGEKQWTLQLNYGHLTGVELIPDYSTIFVDEFGQFASQYDFDNPFVMQYLQKFLRLFRHWTDGKLIFTDQSSSNIVKALRTRMNQVYHLSDFHREFFFFFKVNVQELHFVEDGVQTITTQEEVNDLPYFFGYLPFKYLTFLNPFKKNYDSRCYSITYQPIRNSIPHVWNHYKTSYFIDLPNNTAMRKQFRQDGFIKITDMLNYLKEWENNTKVGAGLGGVGTPTPQPKEIK